MVEMFFAGLVLLTYYDIFVSDTNSNPLQSSLKM